MKKVPLLFVLAVLVPSVVLALLAARTLRDQQFVVERQQSLLYQTVTDALAKEINDYLADQQRQFNELVESLVTNPQPRAAAATFDNQLRAAWPMAEVGFCVTLNGSLLCPSPVARPETRTFCLDNGGFLNECGDHVREIVARLNDLAGDRAAAVKGSLTITIDFKLDKGVFELTPELKVKLPKPPRMRSIAWATPDNNLSPTNPRQLSMFGGPRAVVDIPVQGEVHKA